MASTASSIPAEHFFLDRAAAEDDPCHKQLIPYCIFRHRDRILHYTRGKSGGESRLHALGSVGIGGHVNPIDTERRPLRRRRLPRRASAAKSTRNSSSAARGASASSPCSTTTRIPSARSTSASSTSSNSKPPTSAAHEDALANLSLQPLSELRGPLYDGLETWSRHCIDALAWMRG